MLNIKNASFSDSLILGSIHANSWKSAYKNIISDEILNSITVEKRALFFKKALIERWEEDAIIYKDNIPVGLIGFRNSLDEDLTELYAEISGLYILPQFCKIGIGSKLINWCINELKSRDFSYVSLWVLEDNKSAIAFYQKQGFVFDGTKKTIFIGRELNELRCIKHIKQ